LLHGYAAAGFKLYAMWCAADDQAKAAIEKKKTLTRSIRYFMIGPRNLVFSRRRWDYQS
jgi:hypothetical protein